MKNNIVWRLVVLIGGFLSTILLMGNTVWVEEGTHVQISNFTDDIHRRMYFLGRLEKRMSALIEAQEEKK